MLRVLRCAGFSGARPIGHASPLSRGHHGKAWITGGTFERASLDGTRLLRGGSAFGSSSGTHERGIAIPRAASIGGSIIQRSRGYPDFPMEPWCVTPHSYQPMLGVCMGYFIAGHDGIVGSGAQRYILCVHRRYIDCAQKIFLLCTQRMYLLCAQKIYVLAPGARGRGAELHFRARIRMQE